MRRSPGLSVAMASAMVLTLWACRQGVREGEIVPVPTPGQLPGPGQTLAEQTITPSSFIFQGTVKRARASNLRNLAPTDSTSIVTVNRVYSRPGTLDDFTGRDITLLTRGPAATGSVSVFITEVVIYGSTIGASEVSRLDPAQDSLALRRVVDRALQERADQRLKARIDSSTVIVMGRVDSVRPAPEVVRGVPASEHWPDWREAFVRVDSVLKGNAAGAVVVLYPNSTDVVWAISPKFQAGQDGIWLLRRESHLGPAVAQYLTALNPLAIQPRSQSARIRRLIPQ